MTKNALIASLKPAVEALLMAAMRPLTLSQLLAYFEEETDVDKPLMKAILAELAEDCASRGIELIEVASGYRFQVKTEYMFRITRLFEEKPVRYSRALLETLALIAYRQPITRGEIEAIRGVSVSSSVIKTLEEREWIRTVGHRDVPGRPALLATTAHFLNYFGLKRLDQLPVLPEAQVLGTIEAKAGQPSASPEDQVGQTQHEITEANEATEQQTEPSTQETAEPSLA